MNSLKAPLTLLILFISFFPIPSSATFECTWRGTYCYDPSSDISVGDTFRWIVDKHFEYDIPVSYLANSTELPTIEIQVIKELRAVDHYVVAENWSEFFQTTITVRGQFIGDDLAETISFDPEINFLQNINYLIQPILYLPLGQEFPVNRYEYYYEDRTNFSIFGKTELDTVNLTRQHSLSHGIYYDKSIRIVVEDTTSYIRSVVDYEIRTNITNGIIQQINYDEQNFDTNENFNYAITYQSISNVSKNNNLPEALSPFGAAAFVAIVVLIVNYRDIISYFRK